MIKMAPQQDGILRGRFLSHGGRGRHGGGEALWNPNAKSMRGGGSQKELGQLSTLKDVNEITDLYSIGTEMTLEAL
jgi:hypothetical protein